MRNGQLTTDNAKLEEIGIRWKEIGDGLLAWSEQLMRLRNIYQDRINSIDVIIFELDKLKQRHTFAEVGDAKLIGKISEALEKIKIEISNMKLAGMDKTAEAQRRDNHR